jgi:hypothetical protein
MSFWSSLYRSGLNEMLVAELQEMSAAELLVDVRDYWKGVISEKPSAIITWMHGPI